ncbi:curli-like amyloid fiber formation chaperone CsgH [Microbaculum marinum]|uniref:Curli-like amyloid fiber formation chaperone CsgH n=1 Tax=Microbaculum marinum TaxID=1764581 RepID=A0AAW9RYP3_9HYPH
MTRTHRRFAARILPAVLGLGMIGIGATPSAPARASAAVPVSCEILATRSGGAVALSGILHADTAVQGFYWLSVVATGGGSSNISQSGGFSVESGGAITLGQVTLVNSGAVYDARLKVTISDRTYSCTQRIGSKT